MNGNILKRAGKLMGATMLVAAVMALPARGEAPQVASVSVSGSGIHWAPLVEVKGFVLTISGGDHYTRREFGPGENPSFAEATRLKDDTYTWELRAIPLLPKPDYADPANGRDTGEAPKPDNYQAPEPLVLSGAFTVVQGAIVDSNLLEAEPAPVDELFLAPTGERE